MHSAGVAKLSRSHLTAEENMLRKDFGGDVGGFENGFLSCWRYAGFDGRRIPERKTQKQQREKHNELCSEFHRHSFQSDGMVQDSIVTSKDGNGDSVNAAKG